MIHDITLDNLAAILYDAVIMHHRTAGEEIIVPNIFSNIYISIDLTNNFIVFSSEWPLAQGQTTFKLFENLVNLNALSSVIKFSLNYRGGKLSGSYSLPWHEGLDRRTFIRMIRVFYDQFAVTINEAVRMELARDLPKLL